MFRIKLKINHNHRINKNNSKARLKVIKAILKLKMLLKIRNRILFSIT